MPLPWRAERDTWERAAARAGGFAEHAAGGPPHQKIADAWVRLLFDKDGSLPAALPAMGQTLVRSERASGCGGGSHL